MKITVTPDAPNESDWGVQQFPDGTWQITYPDATRPHWAEWITIRRDGRVDAREHVLDSGAAIYLGRGKVQS